MVTVLCGCPRGLNRFSVVLCVVPDSCGYLRWSQILCLTRSNSNENDGGPKRRGKCGRERCDLRPEAQLLGLSKQPSKATVQEKPKKRDNGILPLAVVGDVAKETECCGQLAATGTAERSREDNSKAQRQGKKGGCRQGQSRSPHVPRVRRNWAPRKLVPSLRTEQ